MSRRPIRRALVSVYDKTGLGELATGLAQAGVTIISTGSTADAIAAAGAPVIRVEELTGFPEILDGRVKTLHPNVHAGLLADPTKPAHGAALDELGIEAFDLLVGNLYPFAATVASGATAVEVVEQIDIGGPAMLRAAAKNHAAVAVVTSPAAYPEVLKAVADGGFTGPDRARLAASAFAHTAAYDAAVASWFHREHQGDESGWPGYVGLALERAAVLRYGENPHQPGALYVAGGAPAGLAQAEQLHGKAMSYNNYTDADAAWRTANDFTEPCVAIIKHANPCGISLSHETEGEDIAGAHHRAHECDPVSAFGGVIAANRPVTLAMAEQVAEVFTEVIVAPGYEPDALAVLTRKASLRILVPPAWTAPDVELRAVSGGMLAQRADRIDAPGDDPATWTLVSGEPPDEPTRRDLAFAWRAVRSVKSNAILLAGGGATVGVGMGQVNRVDAARLAVSRAGDRARGAVAASDAFFPFPDGLAVLVEAGVRAVVQPGGSKRDPDVIAAAQAAGIPMYLTGTRHFTH